MANIISSKDHPITNINNPDGSRSDLLETESYAQALAKFAMECETPLTIGVQGEWGSGKTSLLNMIEEIIQNKDVKQGRTSGIKGVEVYKHIWVNTWEHSLLKTPEECLLSIIEDIIESIADVDGNWKAVEKTKSALIRLAKSAVRIGTSVSLGQEAANELGSSFNNTNSVRSLRTALEDSIKALISRDQNKVERFIIFVDDLDRLDPVVAVMILELLKNIFHIDHCVFILSIDYQVVFKGLKGKFGEPTDQNEWEFRAFFDKIIQLPFMMPMGAYNLDGYIEGLLLSTSYFTKNELGVLKTSQLMNIVKLTIGYNPRALKRLVNSLSLIRIQKELSDSTKPKAIKDDDFLIKQLLIALVCIQISFPKLYSLLLKSPIFYEWDDDSVDKMSEPSLLQSKEVDIALKRAKEIYEEDFDDEWEQSFFKISWVNGWHKNRLREISMVLGIIKDKILLQENNSEGKEKILKEALRLTAVTSVASTDDITSARATNEDNNNKLTTNALWKEFAKKMANNKSCFAKVTKRPEYSVSYYDATPKLIDDDIRIITYSDSKAMLRIQTRGLEDQEKEIRIFQWLSRYAQEFETKTSIRPIFKVGTNQVNQYFSFERSEDFLGDKSNRDLSLAVNKQFKTNVFNWLETNTVKIESIIERAYEEFRAYESKKIEEEVISSNQL